MATHAPTATARSLTLKRWHFPPCSSQPEPQSARYSTLPTSSAYGKSHIETLDVYGKNLLRRFIAYDTINGIPFTLHICLYITFSFHSLLTLRCQSSQSEKWGQLRRRSWLISRIWSKTLHSFFGKGGKRGTKVMASGVLELFDWSQSCVLVRKRERNSELGILRSLPRCIVMGRRRVPCL